MPTFCVNSTIHGRGLACDSGLQAVGWCNDQMSKRKELHEEYARKGMYGTSDYGRLLLVAWGMFALFWISALYGLLTTSLHGDPVIFLVCVIAFVSSSYAISGLLGTSRRHLSARRAAHKER